MSRRASALVSTQWLADRLTAPNLRLLDGSWHLSSEKRDPRAEFSQSHLPGAQFFDIVGCSDHTSKFDYMLPHPEQFEEYVGSKLGITNDTHVVVYDNNDKLGLFSAPRVWWMFRLFGHQKVSVVNGGLPKWKVENRDVTKIIQKVESQKFVARPNYALLKSFESMEDNIREKSYCVLDARSPDTFNGVATGKSIPPGHMPDAVNIPYRSLVDPDTKTLLPPTRLRQVFTDAGIQLSAPITTTCGKGISACMLALAAYECGSTEVAVYDGSWQEWYHRAEREHLRKLPTHQS